ncbi:TniB family NTP-binding protein [Phenylobacterium sp.]|uniref:TniB family NTP-binding protein n=1 Tax=Phenylobacterium sp. TaxID=1871053 RepID=UPI0035B46B7C
MTLKLTAPTEPFAHLHETVRDLALADPSTRKAAIYTERWIDYPAGVDAIERMFELLLIPPRTRMPSILFWAAPNMGKTFIQAHFEALLKEDTGRRGFSESAVVRYELSGGLDERRLYVELLLSLGAPAPEKTSRTRLQRQLLQQFGARGVRLLILDEFQRVTKLSAKDEAEVVDALRLLSSQAHLCLAAFGSSEAKGLIEADPHLRERFELVELPKWQRRAAWSVKMVSERISFMPLRKPTQVDREFMDMLKEHSDESLGRMFHLLERCAVAALEEEEYITPALIHDVALRKRRVVRRDAA